MIDGALGMAYGVSSTTFLMATGVSPVAASASVHLAEVFTTAASGLSHWRLKNIDKSLFKKLAIPGAIGAALGAWFLVTIDGNIIKPFISGYLLLMGLYIIFKTFRKNITFTQTKRAGWVALFGGFVDASGGGGWGPVVTTNLVAFGNNPRFTIGSVTAAEFIVAVAATGVFTVFIGITNILVVVGLICGGLIAAPLGAMITRRINLKIAMILVGILIIIISSYTIFKTF